MQDVRQCSKCGYLSIRHTDDHQLYEASSVYRNTGHVPHAFNRSADTFSRVPVCFVMAWPLDAEAPSEYHKNRDKIGVQDALKIIDKDRMCHEFTDWIPGHTPKEHREMMLSRELLREERKWREDQAERERQWRKEDRRSNLSYLIVAAVSAVIGAIAVLIAADKLPWFN
jgi:hypothetical protein